MADANAIKVSLGFNSFPPIPVSVDWNLWKTVFSARQRFPKPVEPYQVLTFFGNNIVTSEFDEWKQHRKIAAPAFNEVGGQNTSLFHPV